MPPFRKISNLGVNHKITDNHDASIGNKEKKVLNKAGGSNKAFGLRDVFKIKTLKKALEKISYKNNEKSLNFDISVKKSEPIQEKKIYKIIYSLLQSLAGKELSDKLGYDDARRLLVEYCKSNENSVINIAQTQSLKELLSMMELVVKLEIKNLNTAQNHIEGLISKDLSCGIYAEICEEEKYNPEKLTGKIDRAATWILNASNSNNDKGKIAVLLNDYANNNKDLRNYETIKEIHGLLLPFPEKNYRAPAVAGGSLPSSTGGEAMLVRHMNQHFYKKNFPAKDLGKHLFACVVGYHGFSDGNGRLGRMLFAIEELRNNRFKPMSTRAEEALHNLN